MTDEIDLMAVINTQAAKISELEREVGALRSELRYQSTGEPTWGSEGYWRESYLIGKIQRQAATIRKIQKIGWQPTVIIREVPDPEDAYLWLSDEQLRTDGHPKKQRRQNRYPVRS